jgi:hypothetical protein
LAKTALLFSLPLFCLNLSGCQCQIEPTYKERDLPYLVKQISKEEYGLDVTTQRTDNTLWIYAPLSKILSEEYGIKEDKMFDEGMTDKLRNILTTIGRVLISSDYTPDFFALVASDINLGIDYTVIGSVLDIKKSYAGIIPWTEANRRYVIRLNLAPEAVGDTAGKHLIAYDIRLADFLSEQIAQRIAVHFQEEGRKKYFKVEKSEGRFFNDAFVLEYSITQIAQPPQPADIKKEILDIITYCIKTYEFKDFSMLELTDLVRQDKLTLSKAAIWARTTD